MSMTHAERLALAVQFNKERVANKLAGQIATRDLIKASDLTNDELKGLVDLYPAFSAGVNYKIDDIIRYNGELYRVIQAHTSQIEWTPDTTPALFTSFTPELVIPAFVQPTGASDAYNIGDRVMFESKVYESTINANVWSPTTYPTGWKEVIV